MKLVTSLQGSVALRYSPDETAPDSGILSRDLVAFVAKEYEFSVVPDVPAGLLINPVFPLQTGRVVIDENIIPIHQITMVVGGMVVTAKSTDLAELVAGHCVNRLDADLGYKITNNIRARYYTSNIVVEFVPELEKQIAAIAKAKDVLEREIKRPYSFSLKRLAFGDELPAVPMLQMFSIDDIPKQDFTIERRAGEPLSANHYICSGPLQTNELVRVMTLVEEAMRT